MRRHALFLSIRPEYARRILAGQKSVELRRTRPLVPDGAVLLLYVSSPVMALRALSSVQGVTSAPPDRLWPTIKERAGVTRSEFDSYFAGADQAYAIHLGKVYCLSPPVELARLREVWPSLNPPQTYRYFTECEYEALIRAVGNHTLG